MVIKRPAGQETQALIADLDAEDDVRRETAIARLAVIGTRAVDRLVAVVAGCAAGGATGGGGASSAPTGRGGSRASSVPRDVGSAPTERAVVGALHALEAIADVRALPSALALIESTLPDVAAAAVGVTRAFLHGRRAPDVLDRLVALALDTGRPDAPRLAALDALNETGTRVLGPIWDRLRDDPSAAVRQRAAKETGVVEPEAELEAAAAGVLPADAASLGALVEKAAARTPLPTLHRLLEVVRNREAHERARAAKAGWLSVRGAIHAALAARDSRVALYDLRDTIAAATFPLPASFATAAGTIGDGATLEALAQAYTRALAAGEHEWLEYLRQAFAAIASREKAGARHPAIKRIETRWPDAARDLVEKRGKKR